jgi:hypothetical protein
MQLDKYVGIGVSSFWLMWSKLQLESDNDPAATDSSTGTVP